MHQWYSNDHPCPTLHCGGICVSSIGYYHGKLAKRFRGEGGTFSKNRFSHFVHSTAMGCSYGSALGLEFELEMESNVEVMEEAQSGFGTAV